MKQIEPAFRIERPCTADWHSMTGDERKRFCEACGKHVHNLSAMTPKEAEHFATTSNGTECIVYVPTEDGRIHAPNAWERGLMRLIARKPQWKHAILAILPTALAGCIDRQPHTSPPLPGSPRARNVVSGGITASPPLETRKARRNQDGRILLGEINPPPEG